MNLDVSAIFEFVADNPATALIIGGILFLLIGGILSFIGSDTYGYFIFFGIILLALGIIIHEK